MTSTTTDNNTTDEFQTRYERHQKFGKKSELVALMKERHSNRRFDDKEVDSSVINELIDSLIDCPSSCDRHGVRLSLVTDRDRKALLNGLLVGGVGWIYRAPVVLLLFGISGAYKAPGEIDYMPYLDAGIMVQQLSLMATALGLHCAYVNPNIRDANRKFFAEQFDLHGNSVFCGAFAFGYPHPEQIEKIERLPHNPVIQ